MSLCHFRRTHIGHTDISRWRCCRRAVTSIEYLDTVINEKVRVKVCRQHANMMIHRGHLYAPYCVKTKEVKT